MIDDLEITVDDQAFARMLHHEQLLRAWNPRINLTRITDPEEVAVRHFGEALFLAREAGFGADSIADLGAGPGFPGLPIAAWKPEATLTEVESVAKKATFLREVAREWSNVRVVQGRVEELNERFDWVVMRAVAIEPLLKKLAELAPRAAFLAGSRASEILEQSEDWSITARKRLPWEASGELFLTERTVSRGTSDQVSG